MIDLFEPTQPDLTKMTCHSGGAEGSDTYWEKIGEEFGIKTNAYSYKTKYHTSTNKVEISDEDYNEGILQVKKANKILNRWSVDKYMNLLARNWTQVKYSKQVFAIGHIVSPGDKTSKGYRCNSKYQSVDGGTGYACMCAVLHNKDLLVFDQKKVAWFRWSYISMSFIPFDGTPKILVQDFAGIGTREILPCGIKAIEDLYDNTFKI